MIGGDPNANHLAHLIFARGFYYRRDCSPGEIDALSREQQSIQILQDGTGRVVNPYERMRSLMFGTNSRVNTLIFQNEVNTGGHGIVVANAILGARNGNSIQMRSAFGVSQASPIQQYNVVSYQKCKRKLFKKKCWTEHQNVARGFHHHEIEAIISKLQREASIHMRASLGLGEGAPQLGSAFLGELSQLKGLYSEIIYEYTDVSNIPMGNLDGALWVQSGYLLGDAGIRARIVQYTQSTSQANFLVAVNHQTLQVYAIRNNGGNINMHVGSFKVNGHLPSGAFATRNIGAGWGLERGGAAANPSIHQILGIFGSFK